MQDASFLLFGNGKLPKTGVMNYWYVESISTLESPIFRKLSNQKPLVIPT